MKYKTIGMPARSPAKSVASKVVRCRHCGRILPRAYMNHFTLCARCRFARKSAVKKGGAK